MGVRQRSASHPGWCTPERGIIDPRMFSKPIGVECGVICLVREFYDEAVARLGLGDKADAPPFNGSRAGKIGDGCVVVQSSIGGPALSMVLEEMIASGVRRVLVLGIAGSVSQDCRIGDIVVPTWGIREEGTSYHYLPADQGVAPSAPMLASVRRAFEGLPCKEGGVWTVDAPYRETMGKVEAYSAKGAVAVEMECTAAMAIAMHHGVDLACALAISDELSKDGWKMGFDSDELSRTISEVCARIPVVFR